LVSSVYVLVFIVDILILGVDVFSVNVLVLVLGVDVLRLMSWSSVLMSWC